MDVPAEEEKLYSQRAEWADVLPLEQYENITPLAPIFYTKECGYTSLSLKRRSKQRSDCIRQTKMPQTTSEGS